ncbi:MAG TPA: alkaline phosphatase family protein [Bryobacteraceae bacterium]|nr:alkaline phosphatase family protein [Bryobacteraceae bacterium]
MTRRKVLLIGWDAADWKVIHPLLDAGQMPNVRRLVDNGSHGPIATLHPPLSPMLWTSIATGKRPFKHGIHGFSEPTPDGRGVQPVTNLARKTKALWNMLHQSGRRSVVIGWWPSHPAEPIDGVMVSDHYHRADGPLAEGWPLIPHAVHPAELAGTLADLRMHPDRLTPAMVEPFIPLAREIDQDRDPRLALCMRTLAEAMSIQSAATWLLDHQPWDFFAVYYDAIDHFCHGFMKFHPPRQSWVGERDFELYRNVVAMAYRFHDRMLGELLDKAGPETTVVLLSDHGFHPDHLRPASIPDIPAGPAVEHRPLGILAIGGPDIRQGERLRGASVLDVTPTILSMYGLPIGEDMDGKVLSQVFLHAPAVSFIPSWDEVPGPDGRHPPHKHFDPLAAHEALERMIALGYISQPDENRQTAVEKTIRELRYNLGEAYQDGGRHAEAYAVFTQLYGADPDEQRFAVRLFVSCQALGLREEMRRIVDELNGQLPIGDYLKAQVLTAEKRYPEALAELERVAAAQPARPDVLLQIADLYRRLGRRDDAREVYRKALEIDPDSAQAHIGLCRLSLRRRQYADAARSALEALARDDQHPLAHYLLGRALAGMREPTRAAEALRAAIAANPNFPIAHIRLADLLEKHLGDAGSAAEHRRLARCMRSARDRDIPREAEIPNIPASVPCTAESAEMPPLAECLTVVTGLPRSGTSMLMQMLAAGGMPVLSDAARSADEDNPRGYLEFAPVKNLLNDSSCLWKGRGKAVKIVAPLIPGLPDGLPCYVILIERHIEEVLDSQERMLERKNRPLETAPGHRRILREEFQRVLARVRAMLAGRPHTRLLVIAHQDAISSPLATATRVHEFLGGSLDLVKMAEAIDPALHRNRTPVKTC